MANTLPEHIITDDKETLSIIAKKAVDARKQVNAFSIEEKKQKEEIIELSELLRIESADKDDIIGKIVIAPSNGTCRVEFRLNNGSLDSGELANLDKLFEGARPDLFEPTEIVSEINDPDALIDALKSAGVNPWDYLNIGVKKDQDKIIIEKGEGITTDDAILPKKGFLTKLRPLMDLLSEEAKIYIRKYLKLALNPTVVLGTKVK